MLMKVLSVVSIFKAILFLLYYYMFRLLPINVYFMNQRSAETNVHLKTKKKEKI